MDPKAFLEAYQVTDIEKDPLPIKVLRNAINKNEIVGQAVAWSFEYLDQRSCPLSLNLHILEKLQKEVRETDFSQCSESSEDSVDSGIDSAIRYEPLKLMRAVVKILDNICIKEKEDYQDSVDGIVESPDMQPHVYGVSYSHIKNTRRFMEDRMTIMPRMDRVFKLPDPVSYFAVFDGHNGSEAAAYGAAQLHLYLTQSMNQSSEIIHCINDAFERLDEVFVQKCLSGKVKSGSTVVLSLITPGKLYVAWLGDSQAALVKRNDINNLVTPHKPERPDEVERIRNSGGEVFKMNGTYRVNGNLAVSRAIGDADDKSFIICTPDIKMLELDGTEEFLILACDGLWDEITPEAAAHIVRHQIVHDSNNGSGSTVSQKLIQLAKQQGSTDNISVVVVFLEPVESIRNKYQDILDTEIDMNFLKKPGQNLEEIDQNPLIAGNLGPAMKMNGLNGHGKDAEQLVDFLSFGSSKESGTQLIGEDGENQSGDEVLKKEVEEDLSDAESDDEWQFEKPTNNQGIPTTENMANENPFAASIAAEDCSETQYDPNAIYCMFTPFTEGQPEDDGYEGNRPESEKMGANLLHENSFNALLAVQNDSEAQSDSNRLVSVVDSTSSVPVDASAAKDSMKPEGNAVEREKSTNENITNENPFAASIAAEDCSETQYDSNIIYSKFNPFAEGQPEVDGYERNRLESENMGANLLNENSFNDLLAVQNDSEAQSDSNGIVPVEEPTIVASESSAMSKVSVVDSTSSVPIYDSATKDSVKPETNAVEKEQPTNNQGITTNENPFATSIAAEGCSEPQYDPNTIYSKSTPFTEGQPEVDGYEGNRLENEKIGTNLLNENPFNALLAVQNESEAQSDSNLLVLVEEPTIAASESSAMSKVSVVDSTSSVPVDDCATKDPEGHAVEEETSTNNQGIPSNENIANENPFATSIAAEGCSEPQYDPNTIYSKSTPFTEGQPEVDGYEGNRLENENMGANLLNENSFNDLLAVQNDSVAQSDSNGIVPVEEPTIVASESSAMSKVSVVDSTASVPVDTSVTKDSMKPKGKAVEKEKPTTAAKSQKSPVKDTAATKTSRTAPTTAPTVNQRKFPTKLTTESTAKPGLTNGKSSAAPKPLVSRTNPTKPALPKTTGATSTSTAGAKTTTAARSGTSRPPPNKTAGDIKPARPASNLSRPRPPPAQTSTAASAKPAPSTAGRAVPYPRKAVPSTVGSSRPPPTRPATAGVGTKVDSSSKCPATTGTPKPRPKPVSNASARTTATLNGKAVPDSKTTGRSKAPPSTLTSRPGTARPPPISKSVPSSARTAAPAKPASSTTSAAVGSRLGMARAPPKASEKPAPGTTKNGDSLGVNGSSPKNE